MISSLGFRRSDFITVALIGGALAFPSRLGFVAVTFCCAFRYAFRYAFRCSVFVVVLGR
jgi:hypothetical protein